MEKREANRKERKDEIEWEGEWKREERSGQIVISLKLNSANKGSLENTVVYPSSNVASRPR